MSRAARSIKVELDQILSSLIRQGIADDQNFATLRPHPAGCFEVSFSGAEHLSIAMVDVPYDEIYSEIAARRSYSIKFVDGGVVQLSYFFEQEELKKHRLAYYPSPLLRSFQECPEDYLADQLFLEIVARRIIPFPIRFDFDPSTASDVVHPVCHVTLGDVLGCRIPVSKGLTPRVFFDFVLRNFYSAGGYEFWNGLPAVSHTFSATITNNERAIVHLVAP
jgi:hypothetical protein